MALVSEPNTGQTLPETRDNIRGNFDTLNTDFQVDHEQWGSGADAGKHKGMHIVDGVPSPVTTATEIGLYNLVTAGIPALLLQKGTGTAYDVMSVVDSGIVSNVQTYTFTLTQGLIVKVGYTTGSKLAGDASTTVTFPVAFPTNCYSVLFSPFSATASTNILHLRSYSTTNFAVFNRKGTGGLAVDCTFIAIGN